MDFSRSDAPIAILNSTNHYRPLAELDQVIQAFYGALTSAMASILGSNPVRFESKAVPTQALNWHKEDDKHLGQDRITRSEIVRLQLTKLKEASTPSCPLCFKCGEPGHIAIQCHNATLCFVCNRVGHRSLECRSRTTHIPVSPQLAQTNHQVHSGLGHNFIPISCEISVMASIKRLEIELTELKHELALMKKRDAMVIDKAGINAQFHSNKSNLLELEVATVAQQSQQGFAPDNQQPLRSDYDNVIGEKN